MVASVMDGNLLLVGGGKMGGAMLRGWLDGGMQPGQVTVVDPNDASAAAMRALGVTVCGAAGEVPDAFAPEVIIVAVKPQVIDDVLPHYRRFARPEAVFLSIAAGKTLANFASHLGDDAAVVRAMPNTPAAIGRGMIVGCPNAHVKAGQKDLCHALLRAIGEVAWVDDEGLIDAVTGTSGSGPAYVFLMIECLAAAAKAAGLPDDLADQLAITTVSGAAELARVSDEDPAQLRKNVTSPNGTTEAALKVLMADDGLEHLMKRAVAAATERSRELAG
jgi:pyrroline-5-carboxylate reductase